MTSQRTLHSRALERLCDVALIIDDMKTVGTCRVDGANALMSVQERLKQLVIRCEAVWLREAAAEL